MPTISQLTATSSVQDTDQVPVYSTDNGDARKASLSVLKTFFNTDPNYINGTWTNPILVFPDLGTPTAGNLINCIGLTILGGGTGASTADGARSNLEAAKSGANSDITSLTGLNSLQVTGTNGTATIGATGDQLAFGYDGLNYITASGANATLQIQASGAAGKLTFGTAASERMRIDSAGNIGISTTTPTSKLEVFGGAIRSTGTGSTYALLSGGNVDGASLGLFRAGSASQKAFFAQYQGSLFIKNLDSGSIVFTTTTSDIERMRIASDGTVTFGGAALPNPALALTFAIAAAL